MQTIVKTKHAKDFLALVPQLVGFQPAQSVVLVAFRGNRTCGALRFDLPNTEKILVLKRIATTLLGMLCKIDGVDALVPVVYTRAHIESQDAPPNQTFVGILCERAGHSGFLVRDALCVAANGWESYLDERGVHPLEEIAESHVHSEVPEAVHNRLEGPALRASLPDVDLALRERVARRYRQYARMGADPEQFHQVIAVAGPLIDPVEMAEDALSWKREEITPADLALLLFLVRMPPNRDQMMLQFAFGSEVGEQVYVANQYYRALQRSDGRSMDEIVAEGIPAAQADGDRAGDGQRDRQIDRGYVAGYRLDQLMLGQIRQRPDPDRIHRAIHLLAFLTAAAPRAARPAPLCMLCWLSWALGMGSVAGLFLDQALAIDPDYSMAQVLHSVLASGHLPEWAFAVPELP